MSRQLTKQLLLSSNYWVLNKTVVKLFGLEAAFLLSNFAEAETMMSDKDGWFYQTSDTVEEMTTLSRHKQDQCIKELEYKGILKKDLRGMPAKRYFKINYECLTNLIVNSQQTSMSKTDKQDCEKSTTNKESSYKEINKESNNIYKEVYDYYLSLDLIKHRAYTKDISKAIKKAMVNNKYDIEYMKLLLDRHKKVVELTKKSDYPVSVRGITEFFGQKAYNATHLICSEYEEGGKMYETHLRKKDKPKKDKQKKYKPKIIYRDL